jgi:hypothetical protein
MHLHIIAGTMLVFLGVILVAFQRPGLASAFGGLGALLIMRGM